MIVAIHQPNFLPWIGYFNKISKVDTFIFLDDVQLERGKSFSQRTKILVGKEERWITVPIVNKSDLVLIKDAQVDATSHWKRKIQKTIELNYCNHPGFGELFPIICEAFSSKSRFLIDYNIQLVTNISRLIGLNTKFLLSSELDTDSSKFGSEKIMEILIKTKADRYLSGEGQGSKRYINLEKFKENGIELSWQQVKLVNYPQFGSGVFISGLSIVDLVFNCGDKSASFL